MQTMTLGSLASRTGATTLAEMEKRLELPEGAIAVEGLDAQQPFAPADLARTVKISDEFEAQSGTLSRALLDALAGRAAPMNAASGFGGGAAIRLQMLNKAPPAQASSAVQNNRLSADATPTLAFGPLGRDAYLPYAQKQIEAAFGPHASPEAREQRAALWKNLERVKGEFAAAPGKDAVGELHTIIGGLNGFALKQMTERPPGGLGDHLAAVKKFANDLLIDDKGESRFPDIISTRGAQMLADVAAPVHDALKFLGTPKAQIMPDHEVITSAFVADLFAGKSAVVEGKAEPVEMTEADAAMMAEVIGDHENIFKEDGRAGYIHSDSEAVRAKGLFFVIDVLTGVLTPNPKGTFSIDHDTLRTRFSDLYFRHIDLEKGKVFRPEWGALAMGDLTSTISALEDKGLEIEPGDDGRSTREVLVDAALDGIRMARDADAGRSAPKLSAAQHAAIDDAERELRAMRSV